MEEDSKGTDLSNVIRILDRSPHDPTQVIAHPIILTVLLQGPCRRCRERHPHRCRIQLQAHPRLAQEAFVPNPARLDGPPSWSNRTQSGFLTND